MGWFTSKEEDHAEALQKAHNRGQTDASNGVHNKPYNGIATTSAAFTGGLERMEEINDAYETGHQHTESQKDDGGCFLTTACTQFAGLSDDCHELTVLRHFRDTYIRNLGNGEALIREYYALSPQIVPKLSAEELYAIFETVQRAVNQIGREEFGEAFTTYATMFSELRDKYLAAK